MVDRGEAIYRRENFVRGLKALDTNKVVDFFGSEPITATRFGDFVPSYDVPRNPVEKTQMAKARAAANIRRFSYASFDSELVENVKVPLEKAMERLSEELRKAGHSVMYDKNGYLAYKVTDSYNNTNWSTNLTRLRKFMKTGTYPDAGKSDFYGQQVRYSKMMGGTASRPVTTNKCWQVVIAWHKMLNATRMYKESYRTRSLQDAYDVLQSNRIKNFNKRATFLAKDNNLEIWKQNGEKGIINLLKYAKARQARAQAIYGNVRDGGNGAAAAVAAALSGMDQEDGVGARQVRLGALGGEGGRIA